MSFARSFGVLLAVFCAASACKPAKKDNNGLVQKTPARVGADGDAAASSKVGVLGLGGGKRLTVDLQRPPSANESARLWTCWAVPADDFALGRAVCKSDAQKSIEITAANVDITCISNPDFGEVKAKRTISLDFCPAYDVFAYQFTPAFNVKVVD